MQLEPTQTQISADGGVGDPASVSVTNATVAEVAALLGWYDLVPGQMPRDIGDRLHTALASREPVMLAFPGRPPLRGLLRHWGSSSTSDGERRYHLDFHRVEAVVARDRDLAILRALLPRLDPWVVVGRMTIDGTADEVARIVGAPDRRSIMKHAGGKEPIYVGGRWIRSDGIHREAGRDTVVLTCAVVRRLSEVDAERSERLAAEASRTFLAALDTGRPLCPECGPHGNRGLVLLLESTVPCTLCGEGAILYNDRTIGECAVGLQKALAEELGSEVAVAALGFDWLAEPVSRRGAVEQLSPGYGLVLHDDLRETVVEEVLREMVVEQVERNRREMAELRAKALQTGDADGQLAARSQGLAAATVAIQELAP